MPIRPPTHRANGNARRSALLEAAIAVIADQGIGGVTHRSVAARAGMALSTTSYFFASLEDLIAAAVQVVADRIESRVAAPLAKVLSEGLDAQARIEPFVVMQLDEPGDDVVTQFEVYLECARRPGLQASAHQILASVQQTAEATLRALGIEDAADRAPIVVALLDGLALHRRAWPRGERDRRVLHDSLLALLHGFAAMDTAGDVSLDVSPG